ncbi:hypothetical protein SAMN04488081_0018 [Salimicrobium album]|uniref:Uncharacterized protein n=1 Tax=Salimicrobium album TaxID=50717 RepID=A0A1H3AFJ7_9BACI|nr:hypothetical protein SAMN04488081_0018 [Salimicrobium album]
MKRKDILDSSHIEGQDSQRRIFNQLYKITIEVTHQLTGVKKCSFSNRVPPSLLSVIYSLL